MRYAVVYDTSVWIPGDERSRTNPGHGYPERTETYQHFKTFNTEDELIDWVRVHGKSHRYQAIRFENLEVETTISFKVNPAT